MTDAADRAQQAVAILLAECAAADVTVDELRSRTQGQPALGCRQRVAYRVFTEVDGMKLHSVARMIGRSDHSSARHAILAGARAAGIEAPTIRHLAGKAGGCDGMDWIKFAYAVSGWRYTARMDAARCALRAGVSRSVWMKAEAGRPCSTGAYLKICRFIGADPFRYSTDVPHETDGKQGAPSAAA